ncbi:MAG: VanZ family protein, partial [Pseudomonadota bacterium]
MRPLRFLKLWLTMGWILVAIVICLLLIPVSQVDLPEIRGMDQVAHLTLYGIMMFWFGLIYLPDREYKKLGACLILLGILIEFIQGFTSYRSMQLMDMFSNTIGVSLGFLLARTRLS